MHPARHSTHVRFGIYISQLGYKYHKSLIQFGNACALVLKYDELSSLLLQMAEMKWYRKIHTQVVTDTLLPSVEVHEALVKYLSAINAKIDPRAVQNILGVNKTVANTLARRIGFRKSANVVAKKKCTGLTTRGKRCNMKVDVIIFSVTNVLCAFHAPK